MVSSFVLAERDVVEWLDALSAFERDLGGDRSAVRVARKVPRRRNDYATQTLESSSNDWFTIFPIRRFLELFRRCTVC